MSFQLGKTGTPSTNPQPVFGFGQPQQQVSGFSFGQQSQQQQQPTQSFGFATPASSSSGFTFGSQVTPAFGFGAVTTSSGPPFGFGSSLATTSGTTGGTMFGNTTTTTSSTPFNFSTPATSSGFSFGIQPASTTSVPAFGFGSIATTAATSTIFSNVLTSQAPVGSSFALNAPKSISSPFGVGSPSTFGTPVTTSGPAPFNFSFDSTNTTQSVTTTQPFGFGTVIPAAATGGTVFGNTGTTIPSSAPSLQTAPSTTSAFGFPSASLTFGIAPTTAQSAMGTTVTPQLSSPQTASLTFGMAATTAQSVMGTTVTPQLSSPQTGFGFGLVPQTTTQPESKTKSVSFDLSSSSVTSTPVQGSGFIAISTPGTEVQVQPKAVAFNLSTTTPTSGVFTAPIPAATTSSTITTGINFGIAAPVVPSITQADPKSKALEQTAASGTTATTAITGFGISGVNVLTTTTASTTTTFITPTAITPCAAYTTSTEPVSSTAFAPPSLATSNLFAGPAKTASITCSSTGFAFTPAATSAGTTTAASLTTATTVTSSTVTPSPSMNFRQLEEAINKWNLELEEQERIFLNQATEVNAWDRLLVSNGEKITVLSDAVEQVKINQQKLDHELDFIVAQQRELEEILMPLEKSIEGIPNLSVQQHADLEREHTYRLAENIDAQLKRMADDIKEIIEHLNSANSNQDENDPIYQVAKILNAHMDALQWIELNTTLMQRKIDDISKQYGNQKRDQEKPFRTGYR